jgi:hypothetical protein
LAALTACASVTAPVRRDEKLEQELDSHRIRRPIGAVWLAALKLLSDRRCQLVGRDRTLAGGRPSGVWASLTHHGGFETRPSSTLGGLVLETREDADGLRYRAEGVGLGKAQSRVMFFAVRRTGGTPSEVRSRDLALELELVRRLEPEAAARIVRTADAAAR